MRRGTIACLAFIVVLAAAGATAVTVTGTTPKLGLDLQGGAYVVLKPAKKVDSGVLQQSVRIIRSRVDALGVAEPDISTQGNSIVIQLPGVKDQKRALDIVGQTAELRFRPVLAQLPAISSAPTTTTTTPETTTTVVPAPDSGTTTPAVTSTTVAPDVTPRDQDKADQPVILPSLDKAGKADARYSLGPALATGEIVKTAKARPPQLAGDWSVTVDFTGSGSKKFDEIAGLCYNGTPQCPPAGGGRGRLAIVLDGIVKSSPAINAQTFSGTAEISGNFSEREAKDLALVLRFGALPVQLTPQTSQTVSATLGKDSLRAGVFAGLIGLGLVLVYMILYYRALGLVVVFGLGVSGSLLYTIVCLLGTKGLALTLAGTVGIIVSVGVTVDSYVVYFERLKDEIRSGKTIRSSVDRGFARAFRTILAADFSSFIGAFLLYWLTVGSVRGFAFFLGVSTMLDVATAFFFTRPMVILLGRNRVFTEAPFLGVARGLAAGGTTA